MARYGVLLLTITCMAICTYGQICGPNTPSSLTDELASALTNATNWVLSQRTYIWDWDPVNTDSRAILSLQLSDNSWYNEDDLTSELSVRELEIALLAELSTCDWTLSPGNLAYYMMALDSTCHDVTNFFGHNLTAILEPAMDDYAAYFDNYFQYALGLLALCQSGATIKPEYAQTIMDGQDNQGAYEFGTDVAAMSLQAMQCISDQINDKGFERAMKRTENYLKVQTYNNAISQALAAQALLAVGLAPNTWQCEDAIEYVLNAQNADGSFGDSLAGTLQILPLLSGSSFADVKNVAPTCPAPPSTTPEPTQPPIQVTIVVTNSVDTNQADVTLNNVVVAGGSTLHDAMFAAAAQYPNDFSFATIEYSFGHSVSSINGVASESTYYWSIKIGNPPVSASTGIDGIVVEDGEIYTFDYVDWTVGK